MSAPSCRGVSAVGVTIVPSAYEAAPVVLGKRWIDDSDPTRYEIVVAEASVKTGGWNWQTSYRPEKGSAEGSQIITSHEVVGSEGLEWPYPRYFFVVGTSIVDVSGVPVRRPLILKLASRGPVTWARTLDDPPWANVDGKFIARTGSDSLLIGVSSQSAAPTGMMAVVKCASQDGAVEWTSHVGEFTGPAEMRGMDVTPKGDFVLTGDEANPQSGKNIFTAALNRASGAVVWTRRFDGNSLGIPTDNTAVGVRLDEEGNAVVLGTSTPVGSKSPRVRLLKYAAQTGATVWERELSGSVGQTVTAHSRQQLTVHRGVVLVPLAASRVQHPSSLLIAPFRDGFRPSVTAGPVEPSQSSDAFTVAADVTANHWATTCTWRIALTEAELSTAPTFKSTDIVGPESVRKRVSATLPVEPHATIWYDLATTNRWGYGGGTRGQFTMPNRLPSALPKTVHAGEVKQEQLVFDVDSDATDTDRDGLSVEVSTKPAVGAVRTDGKRVYWRNSGFIGSQVVGLKISDGYGGSVETQVTISNSAPTGSEEVRCGFIGKALHIDLLADVSDPDGDLLQITALRTPKDGTAQQDGNMLIYQVGPSFSGRAKISYRVTDARGGYLDRTGWIELERPLSRLLAATGEVVTGAGSGSMDIPAGARWGRFGVPSALGNQAGWLGEIATDLGRYSGIFTGSLAVLWLRLRTGDMATDQSGAAIPESRFIKFDEPVFASRERFAFAARIWTGSRSVRGLWMHDSISLRRVLEIDETAPSDSGRIASLESFVITNSGALFILGTVNGGTSAHKRRVLWVWNGELVEVLREGRILPELSPSAVQRLDVLRWSPDSPDERRFDSVRGIVPARVTFQDGTSALVTVGIDGKVTPVQLPAHSGAIRVADVVPTGAEEGFPDSARTTALIGGNKIVISGQDDPIVTVGDPLPGGDGEVITALSDPVANGSANDAAVAFIARTAGRSRGTAICWMRLDREPLQTLARTGDLAPDCGGARFVSLESLAMLSHDRPVFLARVGQSGLVRKGNDLGIWAADLDGKLRLVVREGESVDAIGGKRVILKIEAFRSVRLSPGQGRALSNTTSQIVFRALFTDGTSGIIQTTIPERSGGAER